VTVGSGAVVGAGCLLHPGVRLGERVVLGDRVIVHHNASIGADGFSYVTPEPASFEAARGHAGDEVTARIRDLRRINSIGTVVIGDDVEIGAGAAIDRANIGATIIGRGTKIDNLVQVGHNCVIGEDCLFSGQVGISGSARIGDRVVLAGQAGIADHARIGDDAIVGPQSGVSRIVGERQVVMGYPAVKRSTFFSERLNIGRIGRLLREVADLRARLSALEQK
jgi:UDP-3-O-[3-hydroxymyristoyl] glucosamine N-acyltransferase